MVTLDARLAALPSPDLLAALERTAAQGRELAADLIALLAECDARQLYATEGYPSLFEFCVTRLRLSESQAYHRIQAARAVRRFPLVLDRLREGQVSLTAVALLREHLTEANHREVLDWADGRRKREVEEFVRRLDPRPDAAPSLRRLVPPRPPVTPSVAVGLLASAAIAEGASCHASRGGVGSVKLVAAPAAAIQVRVASPAPPAGCAAPDASRGRRAELRPAAPARYSLRITISEETANKLRRAQALLGHALPPADPALVLDRALTLLVAQLERRKAGAARKPRPSTRRGAARQKTGATVATVSAAARPVTTGPADEPDGLARRATASGARVVATAKPIPAGDGSSVAVKPTPVGDGSSGAARVVAVSPPAGGPDTVRRPS